MHVLQRNGYMSEVRQILMMPIGFLIAFIVFVGILCWAEINGKLIGKALKPVREIFDQKHPGLNHKLTIGIFVFFFLGWVVFISSFVLDFIECDVEIAEGRVLESRVSKAFMYSDIKLDNGETYTNWFNSVNVLLHQNYEVYYTPHSKTIVQVIIKE